MMLVWFIYHDTWGGHAHFFSFLPCSARLFVFDHLPLLLIFSAFVVYIVLRWRQLLFEDRTENELHESEPPTASAETTLLAKTLEREISFIRNIVSKYRTYTLIPHGICVKRNIVLGLVALFCVYYITILVWGNWQLFSAPSELRQAAAICLFFGLIILFSLGTYALFFWIVSKAIGIAWDDAALEKTPPKIPLSQWNENKLRPEGRRQMFVNSVVLLCMIPLMLILMFLGSGLVQELMLSDPKYTFHSLRNLSIDRLIMLLVILVMLTVLWCSYNPAKRLLGFARLFLAGGLLAFCFIEWEPLTNLVTNHYYPMLGLSRWESFSKAFLSWHLTAVPFLVYSLLAAAFCYLLRVGERQDDEHFTVQTTPIP
jgi:hypothetical protein